MKMKKILCGVLFGLTVLIGAGGSQVVKAEKTTELDLSSAAVFPDAEFRKELKTYDTDDNGKLSDAEIKAITSISTFGYDITDLTGIQYLTSLESLDCSSSNVSILDVSGLTSLKSLDCKNTKISSLDLSGLTSLESLYCGSTKISSLDVSDLTSLQDLRCEFTSITDLDVSSLTSLKSLYCRANNISSLDVSKVTSLQNLDCGNTKISSLDLSKLTALEFLNCEDTKISSLDVKDLTSLKNLNCGSTSISSLDVSSLTALESLNCEDTKISSLDVSKNTVLTWLVCSAPVKEDTATGKYLVQMTQIKGAFDTSKVSEISDEKAVLTEEGFLVPSVSGNGQISYRYDNRVDVDVSYRKDSSDNTSDNNAGGNTSGETQALKKGDVVTDRASKAKYKVTDATKKTVEYIVSTNKKAKKITIPASITVNGVSYQVTSVAKNAFYKNASVTTIMIGNNVTSIGANAFSNCKKLTSVTVGKNVKTIGKRAFYNCKKIKTITIKSTKLTKKTIGSQAFKNVNAKAKVKVPKSVKKSYQKLLVSKGLNKKVKIS